MLRVTLHAFALIALVAAPARAGQTLSFTFDGFSVSPSSVPLHAAATDVSFSDAAFLSDTDVGLDGSFDPPYDGTASFTLTPDSGYALDLLAFSFDGKVGTEFGVERYEVTTSLDGFAAPLLGGPLVAGSTFENHSATLGSAGYLGVAAPVTFRITGFWPAASRSHRAFLLDNIRLEVDVVPAAAAVPEPATYATAGLGVLMGLGYAWRRRRAAVA